MKRVARMLFAGLAVSALLAGCASGVKHADMAASMPTLKSGEGRV
jgi:outer membrane murein-binding lipoprotein Lpp